MNDRPINVLEMPFALKILKFCDGKRNIQDIMRASGLTYKTTYLKVTNLKKAGVVTISDRKVSIAPKFLNHVNDVVAQRESWEALLRQHDKNQIIKLLEFLQNKRHASLEDIERKFDEPGMVSIRTLLTLCGFFRDRIEITREGAVFLKELHAKHE